MRAHKICVVVPTYNNAGTLCRVVEDICQYADDVILVNDGSTDSTNDIIATLPHTVDVVSYAQNRGKGHALKVGFKRALERGFQYAITIDSDGQHYAKDIPLFVQAIVETPDTIIIGQRDLSNVDINGKSSFANKFSNFWFCIQTGIPLKDTQTGYRAYPLRKLYWLNMLTCRYEAELELMVYAAWNGVRFKSIPIHVYYPPRAERVSHFRPGLDFTRISVLNTFLCLGAVLYGWPVKAVSSVWHRRWFKKEFTLFTRKNGEQREAAITLGRLCKTIYGFFHLVFWTLFVLTPLAYIYLGIGKPSEKKKTRYHKAIQKINRLLIPLFPGAETVYDNPGGEDFSKSAVVICNHQSHLDLPLLMSVSHKFVFITKDWVCKNPFFGKIVYWAEYLPVSAGLDVIMPQLQDLVNRGYSVVIFPEGTRSDNCTLQRFHQGAFHIAKELNVDIVPMVLHGVGYYFPKNDPMFRKGRITLKILPRITQQQLAPLLFRKQASEARKIIGGVLGQLQDTVETPSYFKSLVMYKYAYRGWDIVARCKHQLKQLPKYEQLIYPLDKDVESVVFVNSGIGVIPLLCALANPHVQVYGVEERMDDYCISANTPCLPNNLSYRHIVWNGDCAQLPENSLIFEIDRDNHTIRLINHPTEL